MAEYGSSDSGASLGDILGAALSKAQKGGKADDGEPARQSQGKAKAKKAKADDETGAEA